MDDILRKRSYRRAGMKGVIDGQRMKGVIDGQV
jgi:hypothetical protein